MDRAEITINMIMIVFITIVSITLLIGVFGTKLPGFGKSLYCKTFFHIYSSSIIPSGMRVEQSYCKATSVLWTGKLSRQISYVTSFSDGTDSKKILDGLLAFDINVKEAEDAKLSFSIFEEPSTEVRIDIGNNDNNIIRFMLNVSDSPFVLNFTEELNDYLSSTSTNHVVIMVDSIEREIVVHDLIVVYEAYYAADELLANVLKCWQNAKLGMANKDIMCCEVVVPDDFKSMAETRLSEETITRILLDEGLCEILPNNDVNPDCGDDDKLQWNLLDLADITSVLVEYDADERRIVVS